MTGAFADQLVLPLTGIATSRIGALSEASPPSQRFMSMASCSVYAELLSDEFDLIGAHITLLQHRNLAR